MEPHPRRRPVRLVLALACTLTALVGVDRALGATFAVNDRRDALDSNVGDGVCRTSIGRCTLRAAIQEANSTSRADTIRVPAGIYAITRRGTGSTSGDFDITRRLTIAGAGARSTILDGGRPPGRRPSAAVSTGSSTSPRARGTSPSPG